MEEGKIGQQLILYPEKDLGRGRFGAVFTGKFKTVKVAVKKMKKKEIQIDSILYFQAGGHPNIVNYYGTEETDMENMWLHNLIFKS